MSENKFKIYSKTGDKGETSLIGRTRVPKYHQRVEAYGTLDELNAFIAVLKNQLKNEDIKAELSTIIEVIFRLESLVAYDQKTELKKKMPQISNSDIEFLEKAIDRYDDNLPALTNFILPGGNLESSYAHVCRTVSRRAEREVLRLNSLEAVPDEVLKYLNRLSDYFFLLSRWLCSESECKDEIWKV
ncbi:MAG: cob(I)yrinic acid a,c-diamide adenosyltransferase [Bacteroidales bacterium]|jgi:cob(I)alamin adenosyltransferase|nr:cob(I)yrinic acid a,c-diamide adenosyltransferase [Bacteroidales bacterium]